MKLCATCEKPSGQYKYCGLTCRRLAAKRRIPSATVGVIGELRVCSDLMTKGFEVFRTMSQSCSCDVLALKQGKIVRIEVRTGKRNQDGTVRVPTNPRDNGRQDAFAVVLPDEIIYVPDFTHLECPWSDS